MNFLRRAMAAKRPLNCLLSQYPVPVPALQQQQQQQQASLFYSTAAACAKWLKKPTKPKTTEEPKVPSPPSEEKPKAAVDWPRPSEIPYQGKVANSVNLIGRVQQPVKFQSSPDGKSWAATVISQNDDAASSLRIPIIFEGDLAHIVACHLKEKDCVYVAGQLTAEPPPFTVPGQANVQLYQVMVHSVNFVEGPAESKKSFVPLKQEERRPAPIKIQEEEEEEVLKKFSESVKDNIPVDHSLLDLITKPHKWWDIRLNKDNPAAAAFEHKDNEHLIWINQSTPEWIVKKLESLRFDSKIKQHSPKIGASRTKTGDLTFSSWRDLLKDPKQWWDYRENKLKGLVKAKHPDFKHKDGGISLWLNDAPDWVLQGLQGLEFSVPLRQAKGHKENDDSWKNLVENPQKWWDNRSTKMNVKSPDFKHKDTGKALWLADSPDWALSKLPPLRSKENDTSRISEAA